MKDRTTTLLQLAAMASVAQLAACAPDVAPPAPAAGEQAAVRASAGCTASAPVAPGETDTLSLRVRDPIGGELERQYRLHLPRDYDPSRPTRLVLHFHGYTGGAEATERYTGLSTHADAHGYAVVYPQATAFVADDGRSITSWNDLAGNASPGPAGPICAADAREYPHPPECGEPRPCNWNTCHDDLGFVVRLLDRLEATLCVDLDRVYATGMSNGGMFAHRLGCDLPERFAAIAPVAGTLAQGFNCAPGDSMPLALLNVYGIGDDVVRQNGEMSRDGYFYTPAEAVLSRWAEAQGCETATTPYATPLEGALGLACVQHDRCATGAEVVLCTWDGAHDWPRDGDHAFGNELLWELFSRHSRAGYRPTANAR